MSGVPTTSRDQSPVNESTQVLFNPNELLRPAEVILDEVREAWANLEASLDRFDEALKDAERRVAALEGAKEDDDAAKPSG